MALNYVYDFFDDAIDVALMRAHMIGDGPEKEEIIQHLERVAELGSVLRDRDRLENPFVQRGRR